MLAGQLLCQHVERLCQGQIFDSVLCMQVASPEACLGPPALITSCANSQTWEAITLAGGSSISSSQSSGAISAQRLHKAATTGLTKPVLTNCLGLLPAKPSSTCKPDLYF